MYKRVRKIFFNYLPTLVKTGLLCKMPFLYPFLEIKPTSCTVMVTNRCNLKCIMCKQWSEPLKDELKTEAWKEIITDLKKNGIRNIHFTGGEPLLRKDLKGIISHCSQNGLVVGLTTNGMLVRKESLEDFVGAGLRSIAISIDALGREYDNMRGLPGAFERAKEAASIISRVKKERKIDAYINFTLMKNNIRELANVKRFADEVGLPVGVCLLDKSSSIFALKENKDTFWITEDKDFEDLSETLDFLKNEKVTNPASLVTNFPAIDFIDSYFKDPLQKQIPCASSQDRVIIDPYGNFLGGCMAMGTFGNIKDKTFAELRKNRRYKRAKRNMFYKKCIGCSCGYLFNIRYLPHLAIKDLSSRIRLGIMRRVS